MLALLVLGGTFAVGQPPAPADRWPLMRELQGTYPGWLLDGNRVAASGWVDAAATASSARHDQLPEGFNYRANEAHVQQAWLRVERPVTGGAEPSWGFRVDALAGIDYRYTVSRGLFDRQLLDNQGRPATYGFDPVQFYAEANVPTVANGLDVKAGRFFALFGVESIDTTQNAFVSHSYTFIYDPFTHTGALATLKLSDAWTLYNGVTCGSDVFVDPAARATYVGGAKYAPPTGRDSVAGFVILGPGKFDAQEGVNNLQVFDVVYTHKFSDRCLYSLDALYAFQTDVPGIGFANNWGLVQYLSYQLDPHLTAVGRAELFDDAQGQRTGFAGLYATLTVGLNWRPTKDLTLRPELRFDHNSESRPFEGKADLFTAALDAVVRY